MDNSFDEIKWSIENIEDFRKDLNEFIAYWDKEAEDLKNREITEEDSHAIRENFDSSMLILSGHIQIHASYVNLHDHRKLNLLESKIDNSLAIARSNYRSGHKTIWERLIDSIGGFLNIFHWNRLKFSVKFP